MTARKVDLDQLTNRQMLELERASGVRFRELTRSDILAMTAVAWVYARDSGQPRTFEELLDLTPTQLVELLGPEFAPDASSDDTSESDEPHPQTPPPTTP